MNSRFPVFLSLIAGSTLDAVTKAPEQIPALRPPGGEIPPGFWEAHGVAAAAGILLALVLAGLATWFFTRRKPIVLPPPESLARRALEPLVRRREDGALHSRVSQVVRHYFTAAFGLPPGELTSAEFCLLVGQNEAVGPELAVAVRAFLRRCDERKFAPAVSPPVPGAVQQALHLIKQAETRRQLTQPAGGAPNSHPRAPSSAPPPPPLITEPRSPASAPLSPIFPPPPSALGNDRQS